MARQAYFCQVRFLWRLARSFLRRLCLLILLLRRFFNEPINKYSNRWLVYHFVQRILNDSFSPRGFELREKFRQRFEMTEAPALDGYRLSEHGPEYSNCR